MNTIVSLTSSAGSSADLDDFVAMSAVLTGFAATILKPATDAQQQALQYLDFLQSSTSGVAQDLPALLDVYRKNVGKPDALIGAAIMASPSAELARRIVKLWYTGSWYAPYDPSSGANMLRVVSSQAYTNGLVWKAAQAHPMGFSVMRFGYWATTPPPLSAYTGNAEQSITVNGGATHG